MKKLADLRKKQSLTQEQLATKCGISRQFYNFIENSRRRPSPEIAKRIAEVLGFPDAWYQLLEIHINAKK